MKCPGSDKNWINIWRPLIPDVCVCLKCYTRCLFNYLHFLPYLLICECYCYAQEHLMWVCVCDNRINVFFKFCYYGCTTIANHTLTVYVLLVSNDYVALLKIHCHKWNYSEKREVEHTKHCSYVWRTPLLETLRCKGRTELYNTTL